MNIVLIGAENAGKTTTARAIAQMTDYQFVDTDEVTYAEFMPKNWDYFSQKRYYPIAESYAVEKISKMDHVVIATGALVPYTKENVKKLRKNGVIIRLDADVETIIERMKGKPHWVREGEDEFSLVKELYKEDCEACSDYDYVISVSNEHSPEEYAQEILHIMNEYMSEKGAILK